MCPSNSSISVHFEKMVCYDYLGILYFTSSLEQKAEFLRKSLTRVVVLKDVLKKVTVKESLRLKDKHVRVYELNLHYLPRQGYSSFTNLKQRQILKYVGKEFLAKLHTMLKKNAKSTYSDELILNKPTAGRRRNTQKAENDDEKNEENVSVFFSFYMSFVFLTNSLLLYCFSA